ncbi:MAG TPA: MMPL family transporter [Pyrinomonadaceae bacterium]|nr:MMPL family transporter [Pyrinomonadaceae bacterium]
MNKKTWRVYVTGRLVFLITHLLRFSVRHPRLIIALVCAITVVALVFIPRIRLRLDGRSLIPFDLPQFAEGDEAALRFELRDLVLIGVGNEESGIYTPETLQRIARLSDGLSRVEGVVADSVVSISTVPRTTLVDDKVDTSPLFRPEEVLNKETIQQLRRDVGRRGYNTGMLVSPDGKGAAIIAKVEPGADRYRLLEDTRALIASESSGKDSMYLSGSALAQAVLGESTARDLARLIPAVVAVLGIMLFLSFRHPVPALLSLAEIGVSLVWMSGLMGLTGQPVFVTTLVLPVVLICVGVSDDVYALGHYFNVAARAEHSTVEKTIEAAFSSAARPVGITAVSTIVGLMSMAAVSLNPLRVFGIFGSAAILFSTLFTFSLLPALLALVKPNVRVKGDATLGGRPAASALRLLTSWATPRRVAIGALLVAVCAALATTRLRVDDSWIRNLPTQSDIVQGDRFFNEKLAGTTALELMVDANRAGWFNSKEGISSLGSLEWVLARVPHVGAVNSLFNDIVRTNSSVVAGLSYGVYRAALRSGRVPLKQEDVDEALEALSESTKAPIREKVDDDHRWARVTVFIRNADYSRIDNVLRAAEGEMLAQGLGHKIVPFGDGWISYLTVRLLVEGQATSIALALVTDLILIAILLGSVRMGFIAVLPVGFSLLLVLAALSLAGTPLGIANSMFAGIALGIGLDFAIHLTTTYRERLRQGMSSSEALRSTLEITGPAVCVSAASITTGFSVLLLSEIAPNVQLGVMICLCLLTCAVTTLLLIPSLIRLWNPRHPRPGFTSVCQPAKTAER